MKTITFLTQDKYIFWLIQIILLALLLLGVTFEYLNRNSGKVVKRGEKSKYGLYIFYGIISVIIFQVISISKEAEGYKVILTMLDFLDISYLCFFNSWSRNKIMGIYGKFQNKMENL